MGEITSLPITTRKSTDLPVSSVVSAIEHLVGYEGAENVRIPLAQLDTYVEDLIATDISSKADLTGAAFTGPISTITSNTPLSDAAATLTAAQLIGGEFTITPTVARIQTTDTAANIIAAMAGSVDNSSFEFTVINLAPFDVTIAAGVGVTLVENMVVNGGAATFKIRRLTSSTVSVTRLETGVATASIFSLEYESAAQTVTSASLLTLAHGLGVEPKVLQFTIQCTTAEDGYSIGDRLVVGGDHSSTTTTSSIGLSCVPDATNLTIRMGSSSSVFNALNKTTGTGGALSNARWELYVRAYA